jgi:hypothetical protein
MLRYLLFVGRDYHPQGGAADYAGSSNVLSLLAADAERRVLALGVRAWWNILDGDTGQVVAQWRGVFVPDESGDPVSMPPQPQVSDPVREVKPMRMARSAVVPDAVLTAQLERQLGMTPPAPNRAGREGVSE